MHKYSIALLAVLAAASSTLSAADYATQPLAGRAALPDGQKPFERLDPAQSGVAVPNVFNDPRMWGDRFREFTLGAIETGIAIADFDKDGRMDIFAVSKNGPCALYVQAATGRFRDTAVVAGCDAGADPVGKTGATAVDINQDGWPDIYLCRFDAPNLLFVNNGDGTFTERAHEYGIDVQDASVHATFADYDRDGDLDFYLVTNILDFAKSPQGRRDFLFRNNGDHTFSDISRESGVWGLTQGHCAIWFDANSDGWPDLYVANDFETPDRFYLNRGDGTFTDVVDERLPHVTYFSMGADAGDLNNDGLVDYMVSDMRDRTHEGFMTGMEEIGRGLWEMERVSELVPQYMWNAVYLNSGTDHFQEVAHLAGMEATGWTFSTRLTDLDNDGRLDAFFTTGMIRNFVDADLVDQQNRAPSLAARARVWKDAAPREETTLAYRNLGDLQFEDVSSSWGLDHKGVAFGCAIADLDNDGDLDLVYANFDAPPSVVLNRTPTGHRIAIKLAGRAPNLEAIGAELRLESSVGTQVRQLFTERGIVASEPAIAHFGLGDDTTIRRLSIRWPRGQEQVLENLPADRLITINEPPLTEGTAPPPAIFSTQTDPAALFAPASDALGLDHTCTLQPFDEFTRQRLLPRRLHGLGPAMATADVNADGRDDLFISGSAGQSGALYLGQADGTFALAADQPWSAASEADDDGAHFADVNGDNAPDLIVAAGGVAYDEGDARLNDRLYLNDGRGTFTLAPAGTLPADGASTLALAAADFDGDSTVDLFVGGRVVPGKYPQTPRSFLYRNEGGRFIDVTDELAPGLREIGMVTAAEWTDIDGDQRPDLILALEWGPVSYWHNTGNGFENQTERAGLAARTGWWSSLAVADVNDDGRPDIVAGNAGLNTKYHASAAEPTVLFSGVFDDSENAHLIEAQYANGKLVPVRGRSKLGYAFPWLARKFPTYAAYAGATVEDIFGANRLAQVTKLTATELASGVFINQADGTFTFQPLPRLAQIAPINVIVARDFDADGRLDLFCAGNNFGPEPSTGRFDGSLGVLLKGDGEGGFTALSPAQSGFVITGDTRAAAVVNLAGQPALVVGRCEGPVLVFAANE